jgi:hypothetical protein
MLELDKWKPLPRAGTQGLSYAISEDGQQVYIRKHNPRTDSHSLLCALALQDLDTILQEQPL